jgi:hypothetical protein
MVEFTECPHYFYSDFPLEAALLSVSDAVEQYDLSPDSVLFANYQIDNESLSDYLINDEPSVGNLAVSEPYYDYRFKENRSVIIVNNLGLTVNNTKPRATPVFLRM